MIEEAKIIAEIAKNSSKEIVTPTAKAVGESIERTFSGTLGWLFIPAYYSAAYREVLIRRIDKLKEELSQVHEKHIVEMISPQIAGPAFEKLRYVEENGTLESCYISLLAQAINKESLDKVHPGFLTKLEQICADEALVLYYLKNGTVIEGSITYKCNDAGRWSERLEYDFDLSNLGLIYPQNSFVYLDHLSSIGLIEAGSEENIFERIKEINSNKFSQNEKVRHKITLTVYGKMFVDVCIPENLFLEDLK